MIENLFFEHPILNSPYEYPTRYWELDDQGQPTQKVIESRRPAEFIMPIPKPRNARDWPSSNNSSSVKAKGFLPKINNTIPRP